MTKILILTTGGTIDKIYFDAKSTYEVGPPRIEGLAGIVITHGTDTMVGTARFLHPSAERTIVLTGSLQPALFTTSDALFNIGCGMAAVQTLSPGVYIAMNGMVFDSLNVRKNLEKNRFELIQQQPE